MVYVNVLLFGVFIPSVFCNCLQASKENTDLGYRNKMIPNFMELQEKCGEFRDGLTDVCSDDCKETAAKMEIDYPWLSTCDCQHAINNLYSTHDCLADQLRLPLCFEAEAEVEVDIDNCSQMYKVCNDSETCRTKLNNYLEHCKDELKMLGTKTGCETLCMDAFDEIQNDHFASGLWDCKCDDMAKDWCQNFINRTDCHIDYNYNYNGMSSVSDEPDLSNEDNSVTCFDEMSALCDGDLGCQNSMPRDLFHLVECDQESSGMYNCSSKCATKVQQIMDKYPLLYECDCSKSLPTYQSDICARDQERYKHCNDVESYLPCIRMFSSCLDDPSKCSILLYDFLTNCNSSMFSRDPDVQLCTPKCKEALDRLANDTEGVRLMQSCHCTGEDELCVGFEKDLCAVKTECIFCTDQPSAGVQLSASTLMMFIVLFMTMIQITKKGFV